MPYILDWVREVRTKAGDFQSEASTDVRSVFEETVQGRLVLGLVLPVHSQVRGGRGVQPSEKQDIDDIITEGGYDDAICVSRTDTMTRFVGSRAHTMTRILFRRRIR